MLSIDDILAVVQQPKVLSVDRSVAFARNIFQTIDIQNPDVTPAIFYETCLLQNMSHQRYAVAFHSDHLSQEILR